MMIDSVHPMCDELTLVRSYGPCEFQWLNMSLDKFYALTKLDKYNTHNPTLIIVTVCALIYRNYWLLGLLPLEFLLCLFRNLKKLAITSLFAQISNLMAFGVVFWFDFDEFHKVKQ